MYTVKEISAPSVRRKHKMVCSQCGSTEVEITATCVWDIDKQEWVFHEFQDYDDWCHNCQCETSVESVPK